MAIRREGGGTLLAGWDGPASDLKKWVQSISDLEVSWRERLTLATMGPNMVGIRLHSDDDLPPVHTDVERRTYFEENNDDDDDDEQEGDEESEDTDSGEDEESENEGDGEEGDDENPEFPEGEGDKDEGEVFGDLDTGLKVETPAKASTPERPASPVEGSRRSDGKGDEAEADDPEWVYVNEKRVGVVYGPDELHIYSGRGARRTLSRRVPVSDLDWPDNGIALMAALNNLLGEVQDTQRTTIRIEVVAMVRHIYDGSVIAWERSGIPMAWSGQFVLNEQVAPPRPIVPETDATAPLMDTYTRMLGESRGSGIANEDVSRALNDLMRGGGDSAQAHGSMFPTPGRSPAEVAYSTHIERRHTADDLNLYGQMSRQVHALLGVLVAVTGSHQVSADANVKAMVMQAAEAQSSLRKAQDQLTENVRAMAKLQDAMSVMAAKHAAELERVRAEYEGKIQAMQNEAKLAEIRGRLQATEEAAKAPSKRSTTSKASSDGSSMSVQDILDLLDRFASGGKKEEGNGGGGNAGGGASGGGGSSKVEALRQLRNADPKDAAFALRTLRPDAVKKIMRELLKQDPKYAEGFAQTIVTAVEDDAREQGIEIPEEE